MKELKLLAEDWKGEIDANQAVVQVRNFGISIHDAIKCDKTSTYYKFSEDGSGLEIMEPEPRPADSIMLRECDGRHLITLYSLKKISVRLEGVEWQGRTMNGFTEYPPNESLALLLKYCSIEDIRIYDMTED